MSMRSHLLMPFLLAFLAFPLGVANATVIINAATYSVPALVTPTKDGPVAVFNLRSRSETRILLKGDVASKLKLNGPKGLLITFKLRGKIKSSTGEALLLAAEPLAGKEIPLRVGNQLVPAAK